MRKILALSLATLFVTTAAFAATGVTNPTNPGKDIPKTPEVVKPVPKPIEGLVILNDFYATDASSVYVPNDTHTNWVKIAGADRATFAVIAGQFARHSDEIFQKGKKIEGADYKSFSPISGQHGYAQDDAHVYGPKGVIPDADPETFKMLTSKYAMDSGHVYFEGKNMPEANSGSFEVIDNGLYAVDDKNVFYAGKILKNTSPEGFKVTGPRAFTADGRTFFEGKIEKGELPTDNGTTDPTVTPTDTNGTEIGEKIVNWFAKYSEYFTGKNIPFWSLNALALIVLFSFLFVFFADRNDTAVSFWKTLLKVIICTIVALIAYWIASFFVGTPTAQIIGVIVALFFFSTLWSAMGWIKSLLITILTIIAFVFLLALGGIIARTFLPDMTSFFAFIARPGIRLLSILKIGGLFVGSYLISSQLGSTLLRSVGQALVATIVALAILMFLLWMGSLGIWTSMIVFVLLYAVTLWIMRFRMVSNLFAETVRIVRVALILAVVMAVVIWIVL